MRGFRSFAAAEMEFPAAMVVLAGDNGQGKTSILEAIHFLAVLRSFRTRSPAEMVRWGDSEFEIEGQIRPTGSVNSVFDTRVAAVSYGERRETKLDGKVIAGASDFINSFLCVCLVPEDIHLVKGPPLLRRRFMDMLLCQLSRDYLQQLLYYQRALLNRNALLKDWRRYGEAAIRAYDQLLVGSGAFLMAFRATWIKRLGDCFASVYRQMRGTGGQAVLDYEPNLSRRNVDALGVAAAAAAMAAAINRDFQRDADRGSTRSGPHRDDLGLLLDQRPVATYGSEGQCRLVALSLKLAAVRLLAETTSTGDVTVLVDDVFGELDSERRTEFFHSLAQASQSILTCTTVPLEIGSQDYCLFGVADGRILNRRKGK